MRPVLEFLQRHWPTLATTVVLIVAAATFPAWRPAATDWLHSLTGRDTAAGDAEHDEHDHDEHAHDSSQAGSGAATGEPRGPESAAAVAAPAATDSSTTATEAAEPTLPPLLLSDGLPPVTDTPDALAAAVAALAAGSGPVAVDTERASG